MKTAVANGLVQALIWRLREMHIRVGVFEVEQAAAILSTQPEWSTEALQRVLLPILCKRHEQRGLVAALIEEVATPPTPPPQEQRSANPVVVGPRPAPPSLPMPTYWQRLKQRLARFLEIVRSRTWMSRLLILAISACLAWAAAIQFPDVLAFFYGRLALIVRSVSGVFADPLGSELVSPNEDSEALAFALLVRHGTVSALVATSVVALLVLLKLRATDPPPPDDERDAVTPVKGDGSVFRVGSLGGPAPRFLTPQLAIEIVELLNYRQTEDDRRELDLRATLDSRVRGNPDALVFEKRKELPTVVILVDHACDAAYWNTIAAEFQTTLERRGLVVEVVSYSGSLSEVRWDPAHPGGTVGSALEAMAEASGWMLTTIFGDLRRLSRRDALLLADLREQGPVLAFDYNDPRLWDRRHETLDGLGITPYPATGPALRRALASAFAPDRAAVRQSGQAASREAVFEDLSEPHAQWAAACAMVEPVSFALAEKLRRALPQLAGEEEALAFSLLARLPGSWSGPEGLRFAAEIRRRLLSHASKTPRDQQLAFLAVMDEAFGDEPAPVTASELWRYTRAQAELFTPRQVRALQDLADIRSNGLIDRREFEDLVDRLREPGDVATPRTVELPMRSRRVARLAGARDPESETAKDAEGITAKWSLGLSEVRIRLAADAPPLAAFLPGGRNILVAEPGAADAQRMFSRIDTTRGSRVQLRLGTPLSELGLSPADFSQLLVFPQREDAVLATRTGRLFLFRGGGSETASSTAEAGDAEPSYQLTEFRLEAEIGGTPLIALSAAGNRIACCGHRSNTVILAAHPETRSEALPGSRQTTLPGGVTALAFSQAGAVLCGLEDGNVFRIEEQSYSSNSPSGFALPSESGGPRHLASLGAEVTALADAGMGETSQTTIVAALSDGRIVLGDLQRSETVDVALPWRARWLTAFPDRKAAIVSNEPVGMSVAVTGPNGEFDVVGLAQYNERSLFEGESLITRALDPARDGMTVLAMNAERRRVVVRNGLYLEVRPLLYDLPEPSEVKVAIEQTRPPLLESPDQRAETEVLESAEREALA